MQHWAPQYSGIEEHGMNDIPEGDHKVAAQVPAENQK